MGGARRLLTEMEAYLARSGRRDVRLIGRDRGVEPLWLAERELAAARCSSRVALNNVSFVTPGARRTVLLRNAMHFPLPWDDALPKTLARRVGVQARVVRAAGRRADLIVVPTSSMAERVMRSLPRAARRICVWPHPVTPRPAQEQQRGLVVCPVLMAPYKRLGPPLRLLADAAARVPAEVEVAVTATEAELRAEGVPCGSVTALGRLPGEQVEQVLARAHVVFFPTVLESFGYPLAEARANGQPVLAPDTSHNREVAGPALVGYGVGAPDLTGPLQEALERVVVPSQPESADDYFTRLLAVP